MMKTPYYMINQNELDRNFNKMSSALKDNWNNSIIGYSYKTNYLPWIIQHFDNLGCYAEVVSEDEYLLAKRIGAGNRIIYNGPVKTKETFYEALSVGAIVNIDSWREIDWLEECGFKDKSIGIRVNFDIEKMCPGQSQCGDEGGRFGFCYENGELKKAIISIQSKGFHISGIHLHTSSKSRGLDIYKAVSEVACAIQEEFDLELSYVDVGGGFFGGLNNKPQFEEYFALISDVLCRRFSPDNTTLIIEPGMSLIGAPVSYFTTVIDIKSTEKNRFVVTDGSRTGIDPFLKKESYFYSIHKKERTPVIDKQVICGYTCMENDRLFTAFECQELCCGDQIEYEKVGAYTMCLAPMFIKSFPDVYVKNGDTVKSVRNAWGTEEYFMKSILEGNE